MLKKDGNESGPFSREDVAAMLADGRIDSTDLAFHEGLSNWLPILAVITPRATPPPFKEKAEPFETIRVKPNETYAKIVCQTKSLDWKQIIPIASIVEDKPWNLRWVRWLLWFTCTFFLINHYLAASDITVDQAVFLLLANGGLALALAMTFIIKPERVEFRRITMLALPSLSLTTAMFILASKFSFINSLFQSTTSYGAVKRICAILVTVLIGQLILTAPFALIYIKKKQGDAANSIVYYGLLSGLALGLAPYLAAILEQKWHGLNGLSLGIYESPGLFIALLSMILTGFWGAITGHLIASGTRATEAIFGWLVASILVPTLLATGYLALASSLAALVPILVTVFLITYYIKSNSKI